MIHCPSSEIEIAGRKIGTCHPTYFIADIAANHDGDLARAKVLIHLAAEVGADAVKFQHFSASTIVSDYGFKSLGGRQSHQASWGKSVLEVYQDASIDPDWTPTLAETCKEAGIAFFTSPYSMELVDAVDPFVPAFKIGSGDITWLEIIRHIARKAKPVILATGASKMQEVQAAVDVILSETSQVALLQCNTNYTGSIDTLRHIQLNVLKTYASMYPGMILGLSDHSPGHAAVLGAVALGGRVVEKHFTDDRTRIGPDHGFSMDPASWREMVDRTRELEAALGSGVKRVEENERETVVLQRRAIRTVRDIPAGTELSADDLIVLRPCPPDGLSPAMLGKVIGRHTRRDVKSGDCIRWIDLQ